MKIKVTTEDLLEAEACSLDDFLAEYPGGVAELDWTPEEQIRFIRGPLKGHFGWAVHRKLIPAWSMHGADLRGANLIGAIGLSHLLHGRPK